ncbi:MAG: cell division protein SepF [Actinobacteria bacterium]|nr:cell division protein SepF [Actinomycetota bacterium]NBY15612.1 cell division protein SepF [Actinomycetota bacterium]
MASALRKVAEYLGLVDGDGYVAEETYQQVDHQTQADRPNLQAVTEQNAPVITASLPPIDPYRIVSIQPTTFNDARRIGEEFRSGSPVILNLSELEHADAIRLVDFSAGLVHGLQGTIEKVAKEVFLLSPANIDVSMAARAQLRDEPFFNQR